VPCSCSILPANNWRKLREGVKGYALPHVALACCFCRQAVLPRRRLKPRTYRIPAGSSILIGGLARLDVISAPSATLYVTLFVSDEIITHLGKTDGVEQRRQKHTGGLLTPPYEVGRLRDLQLVPRTAVVEGSSWKMHSRDIAVAGERLCWCCACTGCAACGPHFMFHACINITSQNRADRWLVDSRQSLAMLRFVFHSSSADPCRQGLQQHWPQSRSTSL